MANSGSQQQQQRPKYDLNQILYACYLIVAFVLVYFGWPHNAVLLTPAGVLTAVAVINALARRSWWQAFLAAFVVVALILRLSGVW